MWVIGLYNFQLIVAMLRVIHLSGGAKANFNEKFYVWAFNCVAAAEKNFAPRFTLINLLQSINQSQYICTNLTISTYSLTASSFHNFWKCSCQKIDYTLSRLTSVEILTHLHYVYSFIVMVIVQEQKIHCLEFWKNRILNDHSWGHLEYLS